MQIWNSLPDYVVCAETINTLKNRLHKYRSDQKVLYCMIITQISMASEIVVLCSMADLGVMHGGKPPSLPLSLIHI